MQCNDTASKTDYGLWTMVMAMVITSYFRVKKQ